MTFGKQSAYELWKKPIWVVLSNAHCVSPNLVNFVGGIAGIRLKSGNVFVDILALPDAHIFDQVLKKGSFQDQGSLYFIYSRCVTALQL